MEAPGEAEAELAMLNRRGLVHAVITSDSDSLIFGAQTVLRRCGLLVFHKLLLVKSPIHSSIPSSKRDNDDEVAVVEANKIECKLGFTHHRLLFYALAAGGDYDPGLPQCGQGHSSELALAGVGDDLLLTSRDLPDVVAHVQEWSKTTAEKLLSHSYKISRRAERLLSDKINVFPSTDVLHLYVSPITSKTGTLVGVRGWSTIQHPSIPALVVFARDLFGWSDPSELSRTFKNNIWERALVRLLYSVSASTPKDSLNSRVEYSLANLFMGYQEENDGDDPSEGRRQGVAAQGATFLDFERPAVGAPWVFKGRRRR